MKPRVGIAGTGFVGKGLALLLAESPHFSLSRILTRRPIASVDHPFPHLLTNDLDDLLEHTDILVECSGHVLHATEICHAALEAELPVVTMNAEFQVTTGSYFVGRGLITEAEGDQPGCLAALKEQAELAGLKPIVYGNIKGYLNPNPTLQDMLYWAHRQRISLQQVTSFTDGTKLQIEQALVANGLGADIAQTGLLGPSCENLEEGTTVLINAALQQGSPISDYVLAPALPRGVFLVGVQEDPYHQGALRYLRMGEGPFYVLLTNYHLVYMEIQRTLLRITQGLGPLLTNSASPRISVAAVAKRTLEPGLVLSHGTGSFDVRGIAVRIQEHPNHVPIGLLYGARIRHRIEPHQVLTFQDVELPDSLAYEAWKAIRARALESESVITPTMKTGTVL